MSQMGWSEGKGLGADESGQLEHIKVKRKKNNLGEFPAAATIVIIVACPYQPVGIGADVRKCRDEDWLEAQDMYSSVLASLNASDSDDSDSGELPHNSIVLSSHLLTHH